VLSGAAVLVIALATIGSSWSVYQAAHWNTVSTVEWFGSSERTMGPPWANRLRDRRPKRRSLGQCGGHREGGHTGGVCAPRPPACCAGHAGRSTQQGEGASEPTRSVVGRRRVGAQSVPRGRHR
jgi:hypothetical protein